MHRKPPIETYILIALLVILGIGGIFGGVSLIIDSSGDQLRLNIQEYINYPFKDFLFPGILLFILFGIIPLLLVTPLIKKPDLNGVDIFNIYPKRHWAWTYSVLLGIFLIIWTDIQIVMIGYHTFYQILNSLYGVAIIFICLLPEEIHFYTKWKMNSHNPKKIEEEDYK